MLRGEFLSRRMRRDMERHGCDDCGFADDTGHGKDLVRCACCSVLEHRPGLVPNKWAPKGVFVPSQERGYEQLGIHNLEAHGTQPYGKLREVSAQVLVGKV